MAFDELQTALDELLSRIERSNAVLDRTEAVTLRSIVHSWRGMDELHLLNPGDMAERILSALDALAIINGYEKDTAAADKLFAGAFHAEPRKGG